jgi:hypothetical protein
VGGFFLFFLVCLFSDARAAGPALVGNLWGVFYFKEIRGRNNLLKLAGAFAVTIIGIVLIALSKVDFGGK